ncbi:MAG: hypothetical protein ACI8QZ_003578 [Chlamydiales bacterium]|jgi:hypothetical protein
MALSHRSGSQTWTRAERIAALLVLVAALASLSVTVLPTYNAERDGSIYIGVARSLLAGDGCSYLGQPFTLRPSGFAVLIAPVLAVFGTDYQVLNLYVSLFGILALALLFLYQRERLGGGLALLCCVALWLNPGYQRLCNIALSDVPGLALLMLCLLIERRATARFSWRAEIALGICIGLSAYVRSILILLVPAIVVARVFSHVMSSPRRAGWKLLVARQLLVFSIAAVAVQVPGSIRNRVSAPDPPADQFSLHSYSAAMWHTDASDPRSPRQSTARILERAPIRLRQTAEVLGSRMTSRVQGTKAPTHGLDPVHAGVSLSLFLCLVLLLVRYRSAVEVFTCASVGVITLYFGFGGRLLLPVFALLLCGAVEMLRDLFGGLVGPRRGQILVGALVLTLISLDFDPHAGWEEIEASHAKLAQVAEDLSPVLTDDSVLATLRGHDYMVELDRPVVSLRFVLDRPTDISPIERIIDKYGVNTVFLVGAQATGAVGSYLDDLYGPGNVAGSVTVWRVRD